ncbi:MAG TPA: acetylxylan esterase [Tepidisphaeraceae bacterium]|jgi:cephalosporin-C deacetylase
MPAVIEHEYPFDPRYGMTLEAMLALEPPPEPVDFEPFWRKTYAEALATPLALEDAEPPTQGAGEGGDFVVRTLKYRGWDGVTLGAWLIAPRSTSPSRFVVVGHGYYNRPLADCEPRPGTAALYISSRGLGLSRQAGISDMTAFHVLHGLADRGTYVHRGCAADVWTGVSVLLDLYPEAAGRIEYDGESFGGGIGAMALPWDRRIAVARLAVPSFGNHPWRLRHACVGSGEAVRMKYAREPAVAETLRYFDAAVHARRITTPTFCACALFDPAVPPPGQFTVYNAIAGEKELFVTETGHHEWLGSAEESRRQREAGDRFVRRHLRLGVD